MNAACHNIICVNFNMTENFYIFASPILIGTNQENNDQQDI
jgi:hypothetical protein